MLASLYPRMTWFILDFLASAPQTSKAGLLSASQASHKTSFAPTPGEREHTRSSAQEPGTGLPGMRRHPCVWGAEEQHLIWGINKTRNSSKIVALCKCKLTGELPEVLVWSACTPQSIPQAKLCGGNTLSCQRTFESISVSVAVLQHLAMAWSLALDVHCPSLLRSKIIPSNSLLSLRWNLVLSI